MKKQKYLLSLLALGLFMSCAKEMPTDKAYKGQFEVSKADITAMCSIKSPCIYVPSVSDTPREISATRPHWMGDAKLVVAQITEDSINFLETEKDERFGDNKQNLHPVLTLPVKHVDYTCKKNEYNQCGNSEVEEEEKRWFQKRFLNVNYSGLSVKETNFLPIQLDNLFRNCYQEVAQRATFVKVNSYSMNIEVEKTYKTSDLNCPSEIKSLSHLSFNVKYHYSIVQAKKVSSKDYTPVLYSKKSENKFGFFTTDHDYLGIDFRNTKGTDYKLLNRWNPKKKVIPYLLSDNFYTKENKTILESTMVAINKVNESLKLAHSNIQISLEKANGRSSGDIQNNAIVLVDDPQASGVIGYGPSVTNPATGEIVHARTVMYAGTIKKFIRRGYEELLDLPTTLVPTKADVKQSSIETDDLEKESSNDINKVVSIFLPKASKVDIKVNPFTKKLTYSSVDKVKSLLVNNRNTENSKNITHDLLKSIKKTEQDIDTIESLSSENYYNASHFNFIDAIAACESRDLIKGKLGGELLPWAQLDEVKQAIVLDSFMPCVWIPTLVHEFGHNLGLRHNFNGSEDKDNYYSKRELAKMGVKRKVTYSSIMDYSYSNLNELPVMGKYDIAALRFGYAREVKMTDGSFKSIPSSLLIANGKAKINLKAGNIDKLMTDISKAKEVRTNQISKQILDLETELREVHKDEEPKNLEQIVSTQVKAKKEELEKSTAQVVEIKEFEFCTDEHVAVNAGCNRFDEGSSLSEIATHYVNSYKKGYKKRNFRGDRENFSSYDDSSYFRRTYSTMRSLRLFFELYDRLTGMYPTQLKPDSPAWDTMEFLKEIKNATHIAGNFFIDTIKTPGLHCLVQLPSGGLTVAPISLLNKDSITCFDEENISLAAGFSVIGELGKNINNKKDPRVSNPYVDQIDVRGIWLNKVIATHFLTTRELGSSIFDKYSKNFLDIPSFKQKALLTISDMMLDQIKTKKVDITLADGSVIEADDDNNPFKKSGYTFSLSSDHLIKKSLNRGINSMFDLKSSFTSILKPIVEIFNMQKVSRDSIENSTAVLKMFRVTKTIGNIADGVAKGQITLNSGRYISLDGNSIAASTILLYKKIELANEQSEEAIEKALAELRSGRDVKVLKKERLAQIQEQINAKKTELEEELKDDPDKIVKIMGLLAALAADLDESTPKIVEDSKEAKVIKDLGQTFLEMYVSGSLPEQNFLVEVLGLLPDNFASSSKDTI
jgi:hypothetical protein